MKGRAHESTANTLNPKRRDELHCGDATAKRPCHGELHRKPAGLALPFNGGRNDLTKLRAIADEILRSSDNDIERAAPKLARTLLENSIRMRRT
jgi:hypothetical protein